MPTVQRSTCASQFSSVHCVGLRDLTQVIRLGSRGLYPLSHLSSPRDI